MIRYLNWEGETIDELDSADFTDNRKFKSELRRLANEYVMAGMSGYWSQRCFANWKG